MSEDSFDQEWELASGLPLDGATVTISAAEFGFRQSIAPDTVFACLTFDPEAGETREQCFSVGKGWVATGKGAGIADANGKTRGINDATGYGKWITAAVALPGVKEELRARAGNPKAAATWVGMRFVLGTVKEQTVNPTTKQAKESTRIVPTEYLGVSGAAGNVEKPVTGAGKAAATSALDAELDSQLVLLASGSEDHDAFMAAAFQLDGVTGNLAAENAVMASGKGSVWARGQAANDGAAAAVSA